MRTGCAMMVMLALAPIESLLKVIVSNDFTNVNAIDMLAGSLTRRCPASSSLR